VRYACICCRGLEVCRFTVKHALVCSSGQVGVTHAVRLWPALRSLARYMRTQGMPFKRRVSALLVHLLSTPQLFRVDKLPNVQSVRAAVGLLSVCERPHKIAPNCSCGAMWMMI
jgi:hypothetical protein